MESGYEESDNSDSTSYSYSSGERLVGYPHRGRGKNPSYDDFLSLTKRLCQIRWPRSFTLSNIDKYDGKLYPAQWLQIYSTAVKAAGGNTNVIANYLPIMLTKECRNWLAGLPRDAIDNWEQLCLLFISNYIGTWERLGSKRLLGQIR